MKKILTWVLSLTLILSALPIFGLSASAETDYEIYIGNIKLSNGEYLIQGSSTTTTYGALEGVIDFKTGSYAYVSGNVLHLVNFTYNGAGYGASGERPAAIRGKDIEVHIYGANTITCTTENAVGLRVGDSLEIYQDTTHADEYRDSSLTVNATNGIMLYNTSGAAEVNYSQCDDIEVELNIGNGGRGIMAGYEGYGSVQVNIINTALTVTNIDDKGAAGIETLVTGEGNYEVVNIVCSKVSLFGGECGIETGDVNIYDSEVAITTGGKYGINAKKNVSNGKVIMQGSYVDVFGPNNGYSAIRAGDVMSYNTKTMKLTKGGAAQESITIKPVTYAVVCGVFMNDGDYLAVGASNTTTTKPSGGYAYYTTDIWGGYLELNNFSYEGEGYNFDYRIGSLTHPADYEYAGIYSPYNLQVTSKGKNELNSVSDHYDNGIIAFGALVLDGDGETDVKCEGIAFGAMSDTASAEADITFSSGTWTADGLYGARVENNGLNKNASFTVSGGDVDLKYGVYVVNNMNGDSTFTVLDGNLKIYDNYSVGDVIHISSSYVNKYVQNGGNVTVESDGCECYISVTEYEDAVIEINDGVLVLTGYTTVSAFERSEVVFGEGVEVVEGELGTGYAKIAKNSTTLRGDVNGDGEVDSLDAAAILKYDVGAITLSSTALEAADVNDDGEVDSLDAAKILKYDVGAIPSL